MASKLILKKSSVLGKTPLVGDLEYGELALNYADGKLFYKTTSNTIAEISGAGGAGGAGGGGGVSLTVNQFTGTGNATYTLTAAPASVNNTIVTVDGVTQKRNTAYTVSGTTLTFVEAPVANSNIEVLIIATAVIAQGVPASGNEDAVLVKQSATDYDTAWTSTLTLTGLTVNGQVISGVAQGTAPLQVTSTTRVANLNVATAGYADTAGAVAWTSVTGKPAFATVATSGAYADLSGTPTLATVATSGSYVDLLNKPNFATVATSGLYSDLSGTPTLATVATSGSYVDLLNKPTYATVATSGAYADLSGKPTLATVATSGLYSDLSGTPTLATVATSGSYVDLLNKPNFATVATSGAYADLSGKPTLATVATSGAYTDLSGTPDIAGQITTAITTHEAAADPHAQYQTSAETLVTVATATGDIHGIVDRTALTVQFNETTRELTISPVSANWTYYHIGTLYTVSSTKTITITNTSGAKFIYIDAAGNLNEHSVPDFASNVYLSYIYWNATESRAVIVGDERHGSKRDTTWHSAQHQNVGTVWRSGGDLSYTLNSDSAVQIGVGTPTVIADEDLVHTITHSATPTNNFEQTLTGAASFEVVYLSGTAYTSTITNTVPWLHSGNVAQYNSIVANSGSLATATEDKFITYWLIATNDMRPGRGAIKLVLGRQLNDTLDQAYAESFTEYGLSFAEQVFMYQIVVQYNTANTNNTARVKLSGIRKILAKLATTSVAAAPATSHSVLTGRNDTDAHPIAAITNLQTALDAKQATLVSGTSIKTVNATSLLGSGDIAVQTPLVSGTSIKTVNATSLLGSGDVAVQATLVSGTNIKTVNATSLLGSGDIELQTPLVSGTSIKTVNATSLLGSGDIAVQATLVSGTNIKTVNSTSLLDSGDIAVQATLVSGTNIKTVNSTSLLGSGDIAVQPTLVSGTNIKTVNSTTLLGSGNIVVEPVTYTFGGTGTPATGNAVTPYLRVMSAGTCSAASLVVKTVPSGGSFVVSVMRSSDNGATFPTTVTTLTLTTGNRIVTTTPTTALTAGDLLRLDISSVNGAADWNVQLKAG